jgi:hypothetical protein
MSASSSGAAGLARDRIVRPLSQPLEQFYIADRDDRLQARHLR